MADKVKLLKVGILILVTMFFTSGCVDIMRTTFRSLIPYSRTNVKVIEKAEISSERRIFVKYIDYGLEYITDIIGNSKFKILKSEIQIFSANPAGKEIKLIKRIIIKNPKGSIISGFIISSSYYGDEYRELYLRRVPQYSEKIFNGVEKIGELSYSHQKEIIAFSTNMGLIYIMKINNGNVVKIIDSSRIIKDLKWSPDGTKLYITESGTAAPITTFPITSEKKPISGRPKEYIYDIITDKIEN